MKSYRKNAMLPSIPLIIVGCVFIYLHDIYMKLLVTLWSLFKRMENTSIFCMGQRSVFWWIIFHSYVCLLEGMPTKRTPCLMRGSPAVRGDLGGAMGDI